MKKKGPNDEYVDSTCYYQHANRFLGNKHIFYGVASANDPINVPFVLATNVGIMFSLTYSKGTIFKTYFGIPVYEPDIC